MFLNCASIAIFTLKRFQKVSLSLHSLSWTPTHKFLGENYFPFPGLTLTRAALCVHFSRESSGQLFTAFGAEKINIWSVTVQTKKIPHRENVFSITKKWKSYKIRCFGRKLRISRQAEAKFIKDESAYSQLCQRDGERMFSSKTIAISSKTKCFPLFVSIFNSRKISRHTAKKMSERT